MFFIRSLLLPLTVIVGLTAAGLVAADEAEDKQTKEDLAAFKSYLEKNHPAEKNGSQTGQARPSRLDSPEIRQAYGKLRFYYVYQGAYFGGPPPPPSAPKSYLEGFTLTLGIDEKGKNTPYLKPNDFNVGLMKIQTDDDAKIAATAILSLYGNPNVFAFGSPSIVSPKDITVTKGEEGWSCKMKGENRGNTGVVFDLTGKCTSVTKNYGGPLPP